jgi:predicted HTH transcriptional regulator
MENKNMTDPFILFQNPNEYINYFKTETEGQYFDRKEVRVDNLKKARESIKETISAFANSRGGVIVVGLNNSGDVIGLDSLDENAYNSLVQLLNDMRDHYSRTRDCLMDGKKVLLIYTPESGSGICKTIESSPKGWKREGANNLPLTADDESRLIIEKNSKFEELSCCEYEPSLLNGNLLNLFKKSYLEKNDSSFDYSDEDFLLKAIGACKKENQVLFFTNAGFLFFASNPRSRLSSAYVRFLKYESESKDFKNPGTAIFDRDIDGSLPDILQKVRLLIEESAFFKRYSYRDPKGSGIIDETEYPLSAVEEAVVNSIIHRDYNSNQPILCIAYKDAFIVRSPGRIIQPSFIPVKFSLHDRELQTYRRNSKLVEWSRIIRDDKGRAFVKSLSEGTRTMKESMEKKGLKSPEYDTNGFTTVSLYNNFIERERQNNLNNSITETSNLYELDIQQKHDSSKIEDFYKLIKNLFVDKINNKNWMIDKFEHGQIEAHRKGDKINIDNRLNDIIRIIPIYSFQFHTYSDKYFFSVDYNIGLRNILSFDKLLNEENKDKFLNKRVRAKFGDAWNNGKIVEVDNIYTKVYFYESETTEEISNESIVPYLSKSEITSILKSYNINFNLDSKMKELSLAASTNASRERQIKIASIMNLVQREIFPLQYNGLTVYLANDPIKPQKQNDELPFQSFSLIQLDKEPEIRFADEHLEKNIAEGLTRYGSYDSSKKEIEIIPICLRGYEDKMKNLLQFLEKGSKKYKGLERTFMIRPKYAGIIATQNCEQYMEECQRLLSQNPSWEGDSNLSRIFLVHVPENQYPVQDILSPYYQIKEYLLEKGIPVQFVDSPTLNDPNWKDLNLSLNIVAKIGKTPWVLPKSLDDADLFIGLSYTQFRDNEKLKRIMGYANVFTSFGQWQFYRGSCSFFEYDKKHIYLAQLIKETISNIKNQLPQSPTVHIHYPSKFSKLDKMTIYETAKKIIPDIRIIFVWINSGHNLRFFDLKSEGNGSLSRGSMIITKNNQFYFSINGYSPLMPKILGTPSLIEVNVFEEPFRSNIIVPKKTIASHLLALSKLNWAGSQSINSDPVTIKYARDIATLHSYFFRRRKDFKLNSVLEKTPWFI